MEATLRDGYDRKLNPRMVRVRTMTREEVLALTPGQQVSFITVNQDVRHARVSGRVRTWKRDPNRAAVPLKYGFRECFTLNLAEAVERLVVEL